MFRSLMTIIRELYLYLTKVIFVLKYSVKLRYINWVMWQHVYALTVITTLLYKRHTCFSPVTLAATCT